MKQPIPPIHETPEALKRLLAAERDGQRRQRLQALYLLQSQQARTRLHVARLLGVSRNTVGRWLAAYKTGGVPQMLMIAKAPGKVPLLSEAMREALGQRLAEPGGFASDQQPDVKAGDALANASAKRSGGQRVASVGFIRIDEFYLYR